MAYVLGCFASDGGMFINSGGSKYIQFTSTDKKFLENIRKILKSKHKIAVKNNKNTRWSTCYLTQIGSKELFGDLIRLGFRVNKSNDLAMPDIPDRLFGNFVRGYFEGDGCVWYGAQKRIGRKSKSRALQAHFICGDKTFLKKLAIKLSRLANLKGGSLVDKNSGFDLSYSKKDSIKLYDFMYNGKKSLFAEKKYQKFKRALRYIGDVA